MPSILFSFFFSFFPIIRLIACLFQWFPQFLGLPLDLKAIFTSFTVDSTLACPKSLTWRIGNFDFNFFFPYTVVLTLADEHCLPSQDCLVKACNLPDVLCFHTKCPLCCWCAPSCQARMQVLSRLSSLVSCWPISLEGLVTTTFKFVAWQAGPTCV